MSSSDGPNAQIVVGDDPWWQAIANTTAIDFSGIAERAIVDSGRDPAEVDTSKVFARIRQMIVAVLAVNSDRTKFKEHLEVQAMLRRPDFEAPMLWAYLSHHGTAGVAAHNVISHFIREKMPHMLAREIRDGRVG
jgi:hypothetical protein